MTCHAQGETSLHTREDGFTLIELMVVITIIAVLVAIGFPSYLRFRSEAQDSAAQQTLAVAQKAAQAVALQADTFPPGALMVVSMPEFEGSRDWIDGPSTGPNVVSLMNDAGGRELAMATRSVSGACFYLRLSLDGPPFRAKDAAAAVCTAVDFIDGADTGW